MRGVIRLSTLPPLGLSLPGLFRFVPPFTFELAFLMGCPGQSAELLGLQTSYAQILCQGSGSRTLQPIRAGGGEGGVVESDSDNSSRSSRRVGEGKCSLYQLRLCIEELLVLSRVDTGARWVM